MLRIGLRIMNLFGVNMRVTVSLTRRKKIKFSQINLVRKDKWTKQARDCLYEQILNLTYKC